MGRHKHFASNAERQQAYRERLKAGRAIPAAISNGGGRTRRLSRPARLAAAEHSLQALAGEYEMWIESLPENLQDGPQAERLSETIGQLEEVLNLLSELQLPRGFGRD